MACCTATGVGVNFTALPISTSRLPVSTNLTTWSDLCTNGPFATDTNLCQTIGRQGLDHQFFRLVLQ